MIRTSRPASRPTDTSDAGRPTACGARRRRASCGSAVAIGRGRPRCRRPSDDGAAAGELEEQHLEVVARTRARRPRCPPRRARRFTSAGAIRRDRGPTSQPVAFAGPAARLDRGRRAVERVASGAELLARHPHADDALVAEQRLDRPSRTSRPAAMIPTTSAIYLHLGRAGGSRRRPSCRPTRGAAASRAWPTIPAGSRPLAGSSSRRSFGSLRSAPAIPSRCFMPSE